MNITIRNIGMVIFEADTNTIDKVSTSNVVANFFRERGCTSFASFVARRPPENWTEHWLSLPDNNIKNDPPVLIGMAWRLTLMEAATVVLAVLAAGVLAVLVWLIVREGMWLLWLCEAVAEWLGAPIQI
jgi:hypothetical protein